MLPEQANYTAKRVETFIKAYILNSVYRYNLRNKMIQFKHTDMLKNVPIYNI